MLRSLDAMQIRPWQRHAQLVPAALQLVPVQFDRSADQARPVALFNRYINPSR